MTGGTVVVDAEALIRWLDEGESWYKKGRALFMVGYTSKPVETPVAPSGGEAPTGAEPWRLEAATDRQLAFLEKAKITPKPGLTKGEASAIIDGLIKKLKEGKK
jgi:hypothetical protein